MNRILYIIVYVILYMIVYRILYRILYRMKLYFTELFKSTLVIFFSGQISK